MSTAPSQDGGNKPGSMLPTIVAGVGILALTALFLWWPSGGAGGKKSGKGNHASANSALGANGGKVGAIPGAAADNATGRVSRPTVGRSMIDPSPPRPVPESEIPKEPAARLAYFEQRLEDARAQLAVFERAIARLPKVKEQLLAGANDQTSALAEYDRKAQQVQANFEGAKEKVENLEATVSELGG